MEEFLGDTVLGITVVFAVVVVVVVVFGNTVEVVLGDVGGAAVEGMEVFIVVGTVVVYVVGITEGLVGNGVVVEINTVVVLTAEVVLGDKGTETFTGVIVSCVSFDEGVIAVTFASVIGLFNLGAEGDAVV